MRQSSDDDNDEEEEHHPPHIMVHFIPKEKQRRRKRHLIAKNIVGGRSSCIGVEGGDVLPENGLEVFLSHARRLSLRGPGPTPPFCIHPMNNQHKRENHPCRSSYICNAALQSLTCQYKQRFQRQWLHKVT